MKCHDKTTGLVPSRWGLIITLLASFAAGTSLAGPAPTAAGQRIVTATAVRWRAEASASSPERGRLTIGTVFTCTGAQRDAQGKEWYAADMGPQGKGFVAAGFTAPYDPAQREEEWARMTERQLTKPWTTQDDLRELARFLRQARTETDSQRWKARLEMYWWKTVQRILSELHGAGPDRPPLEDLVPEGEKVLVYSEPAGSWLVVAEVFWKIHEGNKGSPDADLLAWEASRQFLPGETEGYPPAVLALIMLTDGRYLSLYPAGKHASEAMANLMEILTSLTEIVQQATRPDDLYAAEDRDQLLQDLRKLREIVGKAASGDKAKVTALLDALIVKVGKK